MSVVFLARMREVRENASWPSPSVWAISLLVVRNAVATSAGDKILFNGYETWKPDVQRCANYRITSPAGAVCGRCMATCPFQTENTLFNRTLLWAGIHLPFARIGLAKFDDWRL